MDNNELTNESGIIKVQIQKDGKTAHASMYVNHYLKHKESMDNIGDQMIHSVLNELNNVQSIPTLD